MRLEKFQKLKSPSREKLGVNAKRKVPPLKKKEYDIDLDGYELPSSNLKALRGGREPRLRKRGMRRTEVAI